MSIVIAIPCMDTVKTGFMASLVNMDKPEGTLLFIQENTLIYDARNIISSVAITQGFDRVLWLDSDMRFDPDLMERLNADMDQGRDFVSGLYCTRKPPCVPCVYSAIRYGETEDGFVSERDPITEIPKGVFEIAGAGFGGVMTSVKLLKAVWEKYGQPFAPLYRLGEDLSFCYRASQLGFKLWCDPDIKLGHIGNYVFTVETKDKTAE